jgi:hypothetical protein
MVLAKADESASLLQSACDSPENRYPFKKILRADTFTNQQ